MKTASVRLCGAQEEEAAHFNKACGGTLRWSCESRICLGFETGCGNRMAIVFSAAVASSILENSFDTDIHN